MNHTTYPNILNNSTYNHFDYNIAIVIPCKH